MYTCLFISALMIMACETNASKQQFFRVRPKNMEVTEGQTVDFQCHVGNRGGAVQWSKDGFLLGFDPEVPGYPRYTMMINEEQGIYNLRIRDVRLQDEGEFQCQVGPAPSQTPIRAAARLILLVPPQVLAINDLSSGETIEVKENQKLVLNCKAVGSKPPTHLKWFRNDVEIMQVSVQKSLQDGWRYTTTCSLTIHPTVHDNGVRYTCEGQHRALDTSWKTSVMLSVLHPPGPPIIEGYEEGDIAIAGDTLTLGCISRGGNPPPQVLWYRGNVQIDPTYSVTGHVTTNTLSLIVDAADNNGLYRCEATNIMTPEPLVKIVKLRVLFPPAVVKVKGPAEARRGDTVTLQCSTTVSNPPTQLSWLVDGARVNGEEERTIRVADGWVTHSNLTITLTRQEPDLKVFSCVAENSSIQRKVSDTHALRVVYPPKPPTIIGYEEGSPLRVGDLQRFNCVALGGNPPVSLRWFKGEREISTPVLSTRSGVSSELVIRVEPSDNRAVYRCEANNSATLTPLVALTRVTVLFPPANVTITSQPCEPKAGDRVMLICISGSSNPLSRITWWKNGEFIRDHQEETLSSIYGGIQTRSRLTFTVTSADDRSQFTCQARSDDLLPTARSNVTLRVRYKPEFQKSQHQLDLVEGESGFVNLTTVAYPESVRYIWTKDGVPVNSVQKDARQNRFSTVVTDGPVMYVRNVSRHDGGLFVCVAENEEGTSNTTVLVNVVYPATISNITTLVVVNEGDDASFECSADANPLAEDMITWRMRNPSHREIHQTREVGKSVLVLLNVSKHDGGYLDCEAYNGIGEPSLGTARLVVKYRPSIVRHLTQQKAAAELHDTANLTCVADGEGNMTIVWSFNGSVIVKDANASKYDLSTARSGLTLHSSVLTIKSVMAEDYGDYTCVVRSYLGFDFMKISMVNKSIPDPPEDLLLSNVTHSSVVVSWNPGFDGGHSQVYRIRFKKTGTMSYTSRDVVGNSTHFTVSGLDPSTEYTFALSSINLLGESDYTRTMGRIITKKKQSNNAKTAVSDKDMSRRIGSRVWWIPASVVGGILVTVNLLFIIFCLRRRSNRTTPEGARQRRQRDSAELQTEEVCNKLLLRSDVKAFFLANREDIDLQEFQMDRFKLELEERKESEYGRTRQCPKDDSDDEEIQKCKESEASEQTKCQVQTECTNKWNERTRQCLQETKDLSDLSTTPRSTSPESPRYSSTPTVSSDSPSSVYHERASLHLGEGNERLEYVGQDKSRSILLINISDT